MASTAKFDLWQNTAGKPFYGARAWVNFNGTGTVAIRGSSNVSSITDNGTGSYTINFTNALEDGNYAVGATSEWASGYNTWVHASTRTSTSTTVAVVHSANVVDSAYEGVIVVR